ncbi:MAG: hypothetical protein KKD17_03600 [Nanoarchaeota archaeon]|nr:hypothetical protein [Nanoarchaeota archaeon]
MREAARLPIASIATEEYFQGEEFAQQTRRLYARDSSLESIVDQFRGYAVDSGVRVPKRNVEAVISALETHATSLQPAVCEEVSRVISSRDSTGVNYFVPFVKMMCFWDHLLAPYFGTVAYAAKFGEDAGKLAAGQALGHLDLLSKIITYSGAMEHCADPVWRSFIHELFMPIEQENSGLMHVVLASVLPHIDWFIETDHLRLRDPDAEYDRNAKTYVALVTGANKVSERLAQAVARQAVSRIGALSRDQTASRYLDILEGVEKKDPQLMETVAEDCLRSPWIKDLTHYHGKCTLLDDEQIFGIYIDTLRRLGEMDARTRELLVSLLDYSAARPRKVNAYLPRTARIISAISSADVLRRWLESAHKVLERNNQDFDLFLEYRFKDVRGLAPLQDELGLFPIALHGKVVFIKHDRPDYSSRADYTGRSDATRKDRHDLQKLMRMLYHLSAQYDRRQLKDENLKALSAEVGKALRKIEKRRGVTFKGHGDVLCVRPKDDRRGLESTMEEFPELEEEIGAEETSTLAKCDFSDFYNAKRYPFVDRLALAVRTAGKRRDRELRKFVDSNGSGLLWDLRRFIDTDVAASMPRFLAYIRRLEEKLYPLDVDTVEVEEVFAPSGIILSDLDQRAACVFQSRAQDPEKPVKDSAEASLSYIVDGYVHILKMHVSGQRQEKKDVAAAILVETKSGSGEDVILVDGVMANSKDAKYITSREGGQGWREIMLEAVIRRAVRLGADVLAFNISHGKKESSSQYEFARFVAEKVFGHRYGEDIRFHPEHPEFGLVLATEDGSKLPFGTEVCIELRKEFMIHHDLENRGLEGVWDGSGFYHSWYLENELSGPPSRDSFWNKGCGRVRALVLRDVKRYAERKGIPSRPYA